MADLYSALQWLQLFTFSALGLIALKRFITRGGAQRAWVASTFVLLALVVVAGRLIPEHSTSPVVLLERKFLVASIVLLPYLLLRLTATFRPLRRWREVAAAFFGLIVVAWTFVLPSIPERGQPRPPAFETYVFALLVYWVVISVWVVVKLWVSGLSQPNIAKRRMQTLSLGTLALTAALVVSGTASPSATVKPAQIVTVLLGLLSAPLFLLGFAPPRLFVSIWRRPDELRLREAEKGLMRAESPEEVAQIVLPHAARLFGARSAVLTRHEMVIGHYGTDAQGAEALARLAQDTAKLETGPVCANVGDGIIAIDQSPYAPYFGREEVDLLDVLSTLTGLALIRTQQAEELRASTEAMRDFVAIASHDLRTPITIIKGFVLTMRDNWESLDAETRNKHFGTISRHAEILGRLVDDLLVLSKIESGNIEAVPESIPLDSTVRTLLSDLHDDRWDSKIDTATTVMVDPSHLGRILGNLVRNASIYGQPPFCVEARGNGNVVEIIVSDHGPGVTPDFEPRLFEKFARADKQESKAHSGTGLGLSIVRGLVQQAGGTCGYRRVGQKTEFWVKLPI